MLGLNQSRRPAVAEWLVHVDDLVLHLLRLEHHKCTAHLAVDVFQIGLLLYRFIKLVELLLQLFTFLLELLLLFGLALFFGHSGSQARFVHLLQ
eukprot:Skav228400  [mRNA]  locus=scaffold1911:214818:218098:- [translate_table: standard]